MKIGILTIHAACNFGANLQAYTSSNYLMTLGHDVKIINYIRDREKLYKRNIPAKQYEAHSKFVTTKLAITSTVTNENELINLVKQERFDLIIVGADAVWRSEKNNLFFLNCIVNNKELSFCKVASMSAAHMGTGFKNLGIEEREKIATALQEYSLITVRDVWTAKMINRDIFNGKEFVKNINPDPVFLLDIILPKSEQWIPQNAESKKYYLMTLPMNWGTGKKAKKRTVWFNDFKRLVNNAGYKLIELPLPEGKSGMSFDHIVDYPIDSLQWFLWIKNAKAFCGLRFHAIVSSISCGTPFYSIDSYGSSSITSRILTKLNLYSIARKLDKQSKIRNLLQGSGFEENRITRNIEQATPQVIFNKLNSFDTEKILKFRDKHIDTFKENIQRIISSI